MSGINEVSGLQQTGSTTMSPRAQKILNEFKGIELFPRGPKDLDKGVTIERTNNIPARQVNPNDKRPNANENFWNWMNGSFRDDVMNVKVRGNDTSFTYLEDTLDGIDEIKCNVRRNGDTTIITQSRAGLLQNSFTEYVIDNKSGKILQKTIYNGKEGDRYIYDENGNHRQEWVKQRLF